MVKLHKLARLRNVIMAVALGAGSMGCSFAHWSLFHCDECDDFPTPGYGPGFSMMSGSYTGPNPGDTDAATQPTPPAAPAGGQPSPAGATTPPEPPQAGPAQGALNGSGARSTMIPGAMPTGTDTGLPPLPGMTRNDLQVPIVDSTSPSSLR